MNRKKTIGVIGDANLKGNTEKENLAFELGKLIIENGYRLATGGLGGVMEAAAKGARSSNQYSEGLIIGVLPGYDKSTANDSIDIIIPTGMGLARNVILASFCEAVIAVGGGSGTLTEIALAWQMKKLIVTMNIDGWSNEMGDMALDGRRDDRVFAADTPLEAIQIINKHIDTYTTDYKGVKKSRIGKERAELETCKQYEIETDLTFLGKGQEGYVFTDSIRVFKVIDTAIQPRELEWTLQALAEDINRFEPQHIIPFEVKYDNQLLFISYEYQETQPYTGGMTKELISLLKDLRAVGWVISDFQPMNVRVQTKDGGQKPIITDIGHSFIPYSEGLFRKMARRVYLSSILATHSNLKPLLSDTNANESFEGLRALGLNPQEHQQAFKDFFNKVKLLNKKDVLNPLIREIVQTRPEIRSIFDYGSGYGDMAKMLSDLDLEVTAYDPDESIIEEYKNTNYLGVHLVKKEEMKRIARSEETHDCVLCSLVLCHPFADTKQERAEIIQEIVSDLRALSRQYIIVAICNPLYTSVVNCSLQTRQLPDDVTYSDEFELVKYVKSSSSKRKDVHRPLSFYEDLFRLHSLSILEIHQTVGEDLNQPNLFYSDFMIFLLEVKDEKDKN